MKKNSGYKKVKTITKNKTVTYKAGKLKKKKTYYFKIRTYRKAGGTTYYGKLLKCKENEGEIIVGQFYPLNFLKSSKYTRLVGIFFLKSML